MKVLLTQTTHRIDVTVEVEIVMISVWLSFQSLRLKIKQNDVCVQIRHQ